MWAKRKFLSRYIGLGGSFPNQQMAQAWDKRFWHQSICAYRLSSYVCILLTYHGYNDVVDQSEKKDLLLLIQLISVKFIKEIAQLYVS